MASNANEVPTDPALIGEWVREKLRKAVPVAVRSLIELAEAADAESTRLQASKDLLALVGVSAKQQISVDHGLQKDQETVDLELEKTLERLNAGRMKAIPASSAEVIVLKTEETTVEVRREP